MTRATVAALVVVVCATASAWAQGTGLVADIRVHGNYYTPDEEVIRLSGLTVGGPLPAGGTDEIAGRLRRSGKFARVEVRQRYRSLDESGPVAVVILVEEYPRSVIDVKIPGGPPSPIRRIGDSVMFSPIVDYVDGYGFTYGARATAVHVLGREGRVSVPLSWGGRKTAALEADKTFSTGPISRLTAAASITKRRNPAYDVDDLRREVGGEVLVPLKRRAITLGFSGRWTDIEFDETDARFATYGVRATLDTRGNPSFPRNAVYLDAGWRVFHPDTGSRVNRYRVEAQGYLGLVGTSVLAVRGTSETADGPLPRYEKVLTGGVSSLRGFRAGSFAGDNATSGSVELRLPTHSAMRLGQHGFTLFADTAATYDHGATLADAAWRHGVGAGWYLRAPAISLNVDVAYGIDSGARVHVLAGLKF